MTPPGQRRLEDTWIVRALKRLRIFVIMRRHRRFLYYGRNLSFGRNTFFFARDCIGIGDDVYIGRNCSIETDCLISDHALIANNVSFAGRRDHAIDEVGVTVRRATHVRTAAFSVPLRERLIVIHRDVWIGCGAILLGGIDIGECAVVAAGSVVTGSVPPNAIVAGNPARVIGERFTAKNFGEHCRLLDARGVRSLSS